MNYLGEAGYRRIARRIMSAKQGLMGGIESIPGLEVIRPSELSMLLYRSRDAALDTNALAEGMGARGWFMGRSLEPEAIHFRSEEHTSELQSLMRISYAVFCLNNKRHNSNNHYLNH